MESLHENTPPGGFSSVRLSAQCPAGTTVVGTGFYSSIADQGFVKYRTFVVAFFFNDTTTTSTDTHVQAICASVSRTAAVAAAQASTSGTTAMDAFRADRARALADR